MANATNHKFPTCRPEINLTSNDAFVLLQSAVWQNQLLALGITYSALVVESKQSPAMDATTIDTNNTSSKVPLLKSASIKSQKLKNAESNSKKISEGNSIPSKKDKSINKSVNKTLSKVLSLFIIFLWCILSHSLTKLVEIET